MWLVRKQSKHTKCPTESVKTYSKTSSGFLQPWRVWPLLIAKTHNVVVLKAKHGVRLKTLTNTLFCPQICIFHFSILGFQLETIVKQGNSMGQQIEYRTIHWKVRETKLNSMGQQRWTGGPEMDWRPVQGVPCLRPMSAGIGSSAPRP